MMGTVFESREFNNEAMIKNKISDSKIKINQKNIQIEKTRFIGLSTIDNKVLESKPLI
jgi:hypothetical protein